MPKSAPSYVPLELSRDIPYVLSYNIWISMKLAGNYFLVWAGSQVTKLARAAGALALAPFDDKGLVWFMIQYNLESQGKAFMAIVGFCLGLPLLLFVAATLLSA